MISPPYLWAFPERITPPSISFLVSITSIRTVGREACKLTQREFAERMCVSLRDANCCNKNRNRRQYAYAHAPAGQEEKTHIPIGFLRRKEARFAALKGELAMQAAPSVENR